MSMIGKKEKRLLTGIIVLTVLVMGLITWFVGKPLIRFIENPDGFRAWVDGHGIWGRVLYVGMVIFQVLVALIPGEPWKLPEATPFGAWEGTLLCLLGATLGSTGLSAGPALGHPGSGAVLSPGENRVSEIHAEHAQGAGGCLSSDVHPRHAQGSGELLHGPDQNQADAVDSPEHRRPDSLHCDLHRGRRRPGGRDYRFAVLVFAVTLAVSILGEPCVYRLHQAP